MSSRENTKSYKLKPSKEWNNVLRESKKPFIISRACQLRTSRKQDSTFPLTQRLDLKSSKVHRTPQRKILRRTELLRRDIGTDEPSQNHAGGDPSKNQRILAF